MLVVACERVARGGSSVGAAPAVVETRLSIPDRGGIDRPTLLDQSKTNATCYDCHGSHGIMDVDDPASKVHPNNRLETCRQCREGAPEGFLGFHAHGDANDFENYPEMWIAARFMEGSFDVLSGH